MQEAKAREALEAKARELLEIGSSGNLDADDASSGVTDGWHANINIAYLLIQPT